MPAIRPDCQTRVLSHRFNPELGARIRKVRTLRGLQQRDLAGLAGISSSRLSKYESGTHPPTVLCLSRLALAMGLPVDPLLPELSFANDVDRDLYRIYRDIWFFPVNVRHVFASVLRILAEFHFPPSPAPPAAGDPYHASRS